MCAFYWPEGIQRRKGAESAVTGETNLGIAGVRPRCPVYSQQLQMFSEERDYRATSYQRRANSLHGFHDEHMFMDSCLDKPDKEPNKECCAM